MTEARDVPFVIKICGITNEEDAQLAIEAGANALGFNFYARSPRYITPSRAREIVRAVDQPFLRVGVFVNATEEQLSDAAREIALDVVQLHGESCPAGFSNSYRTWRSITAEDANARGYVHTDAGRAQAYVLDTATSDFGGSGKCFDWSLAAAFAFRKIIAGGLDASNVADAIRITQPWGVDACSRLESRPGKKDGRCVRGFVQAALAARPQTVAL